MDREFVYKAEGTQVRIAATAIPAESGLEDYIVTVSEVCRDGMTRVVLHERYKNKRAAFTRWDDLCLRRMYELRSIPGEERRARNRLNDYEKEQQVAHITAMAAEALAAGVAPFEVLDDIERQTRLLIRGVPVMELQEGYIV